MNPYPVPYSMPPPPYPMPPMMPGGMMPAPPIGVMPGTVMAAPPMMHPPMPPNVMPVAFVPPNWHQRLVATPATQPLTLYIGKIPPELDNEFLVQLLETCGSVHKWNRPEDLAARTLKPFGFVTYSQGTGALRCQNVMNGLQICGGTLQVKAGTKEQAALTTIAESEKHPPPVIDPYTRLPGPQQEIDTNALYDAPLRELIHKLIERKFSENPSESLEVEIAALQAKTKGYTQGPEEEDESNFDRERQIMREIEKFRERQAKRDRELEQKRNERIVMKLREMEDIQKNGGEYKRKEPAKLAPSTQPVPAKEISWAIAPGASTTNTKKDNETDENHEAKRRRRLQALAMVSGEDVDYSLPNIPENITPTNTASSEADRDQTLANLAAAITNKAIGGKLVLKSNPKPTKRTGAGFGGEEEESQDRNVREIIPIDYTEEEKRSLHYTPEQIAAQFLQKMEKSTTSDVDAAKKQKLKAIADTLPTARDELFRYPIDWIAYDRYKDVETSMRNWIGKKFMEYLGEEETSLTNFILRKISKRCHPEELLNELEPVLDKDTESFVLKLWRMLIFYVIKADIDNGGDGQGGSGSSSR